MMRPLDLLLSNARAGHRAAFARAALYAAVAAIAGIVLLALSGWFITAAALAGVGGMLAIQGFNYLLPSAAIRLLAILRTAARYGERLTGHEAALHTLAHLRVALFARLISRPVPERGRSSGTAAARLMQDVSAQEDRLIRAPSGTGAWLGLAVALGCIAFAGWAALIAAALIHAATLLVARPLATRLLPPAAAQVSECTAALKALLVGQAAAAADIAAYDLADRTAAIAQAQASDLDEARLRLARSESQLLALPVLAGGISIVAVLSLSTTALPFIILAALAATGATEMVVTLFRFTGRDSIAAASFDRLDEIASIAAPGIAQAEPQSAAAALTFMLGGNRVTLSPGERIAFVGPSGSGKTRLIESLAGWRMADPALHVRTGVHEREEAPPSRRRRFALAPQDAQLIAGTIADNLRLARRAVTEADMWAALEIACLTGEIQAMPQGLESWAGDGGTRLSGGQRKRLVLARALLAEREWLVLDEPSEGLDPATEARLTHNIAQWLGQTGSGLILVSHRAAPLALATRTIRLETSARADVAVRQIPPSVTS